MPRGYDLLPAAQRKVPNDPTQRIQFDMRRFLAQYPFSAEALEEAVIKAVTDFLEALQHVTGIDLAALWNVFSDLDFSDPEAFIESLGQALLDLGTLFLGPDSPLNALNLFNLIPGGSIPDLDGSKIKSGTIELLRLPASLLTTASSIAASAITGVLDSLSIPKTLDTSWISGVWGAAQIPDLDGSKIKTGFMDQARVRGLPALNNAMFTGSNLVPNPGFEDTSFYLWSAGPASYSTDVARTGTRSLKSAPGQWCYLSSDATASKWLPCSPGDVYYLEVWVWGKSTNTGLTGQVFLGLGNRNTAGVDLADVLTWVAASTTLNSKWTKISGYLTIPAAAVMINPFVSVGSNVQAGDVYYFDDVVVREVTEPQNIINQLFGGTSVLGNILALNVPDLDGSKIKTGGISDARVPGLVNRLLTSVFTAGQKAGTNLASDPDTNTPEFWSASSDANLSVTLSSEQSYMGGGTSVKMVALQPTWPGVYLVHDASGGFVWTATAPGEKFTMQAKMRRHASSPATMQGYLQGYFWDSTGVNGNTIDNGPRVTLGSSAWTDLTHMFTVPTGYDRVAFVVCAADAINGTVAVGDTVYFAKPVAREETSSQNIINQLFGGTSILGNILASNVPDLDGSKIKTGSMSQDRILGLPAFNSAFLSKTATGSNMVIDPGFEDSAIWPDWAKGNHGVTTTEQRHSGTKSRALTGLAGSYPTVNLNTDHTNTEPSTHPWVVSPGQKFYCEYWVFPKATNVGTLGYNYFQTLSLDSTGVLSSTWGEAASASENSATPKGVWTKKSGYFTVPAGYDRVQPTVQLNDGTNVGDVYYIDDLVFREVTESQNIINQLFGGTSILGSILATNVPSLDASKIGSGQFAQSLVTGLPQFSSAFRTKTAAGLNICSNPSFENTNFQMWWGGTNPLRKYSTDVARTGIRSFLITSDGTGGIYETLVGDHAGIATVPALPNDKYYVEIWYYGKASNVGGGYGVQIGMSCYAADSTTFLMNVEAVGPATVAQKGVWTKLSGYVTTPPGTAFISPYFGHNTPNGETYYFDDAVIREVTEAQNAIQQLFGGTSVLGNILALNVPDLDGSKIKGGTVGLAYLPSSLLTTASSIAASAITGALNAAQIPKTLDTSWITGGTWASSFIPKTLDTSWITSGTWHIDRIPTVDSKITAVDGSKISSGQIDQARMPSVTQGFANIFNNWFGGTTAAGTPAEVAQTIASIQAAVQGGFTLQTFTATTPSWTVPAALKTATEAYAGCIGGGGKGDSGDVAENTANALALGGNGGSSGGYKVERFTPSTLGAALNITIGAAASTNNTNGGITSVLNGGTTLAASTPGSNGVATPQGYTFSSSMPGPGGKGGNALVAGSSGGGSPENGANGGSSATAVGGGGGAGSTSANGGLGSNGAAGQTNTTPIAGGGGGGGGGGSARWSTNAVAGNGGNGGYPGGGSGGGGGATSGGGTIWSQTAGTPGTPANGFAFLLWR